MHFRRLACWLLGLWLGGAFFMDMVATSNFQSVDRLMANPAPFAAQQIGKMGPRAARTMLRYQVSEQNRWYFETWGLIETALGGTLLMILLFASKENGFTLLLSLLLLLIAVLQRFALTPQISVLGHIIDWIPGSQTGDERSRFWMLHNVYAGLELLKWALGFFLTGKLLLRSRKRDADQDLALLEARSRSAG